MHRDHAAFIQALEGRRKVTLTFFAKSHGATLRSTCAPLDYGPSRHTQDRANRYHFWDYESDAEPHPLSLSSEQIHAIAPLDASFDPAEIVTWPPNWVYPRNWGEFS